MRLIDADELIPSLKMGEVSADTAYGDGRNGGIYFAIWRIGQMPTIEERKKGRWVNGAEIPHNKRLSYSEDITYCSNCHNEAYWDTDYGQQLFDYCPYCGSKMEKNDETD